MEAGPDDVQETAAIEGYTAADLHRFLTAVEQKTVELRAAIDAARAREDIARRALAQRTRGTAGAGTDDRRARS